MKNMMSPAWRAFGKVATLTLGLGLLAVSTSCLATMRSAPTEPRLYDIEDRLALVEMDIDEISASATGKEDLQVHKSLNPDLICEDASDTPKCTPVHEVSKKHTTGTQSEPKLIAPAKRRPAKARRPICPLFGL